MSASFLSSDPASWREQFFHGPVIVFGEQDRHIDIRALRPVFISIECFRIQFKIFGGFAPGKSGGLSGCQQIVWFFFQAASPPHKILTDLPRSLPGGSANFPEDAEVITVKMHRDRRIFLIQGNEKRSVAVIFQLLDILIVI